MIDPKLARLLDLSTRALDLLTALQPPGYGREREGHIERIEEIESLVSPLRRSRRAAPKPDLPKPKELSQLKDLTGRHFVRRREALARKLQAYISALESEPRNAPEDVRENIRVIARADAPPIIRDADEAWRAFHAGGCKASVVMAGATLEGALQAAVERVGRPAEEAYQRVFPRRKLPSDSDDYRFDEALSVLMEVGVLTSAVSHVARGVKELRNFVHPAVQKRQRGNVTRSRALLALQAVATLVEEIAERLDSD